MIPKNEKLGMHRLWLSPFEVKVMGGLRSKMNQFSDGSGTTLTPKGGGVTTRKEEPTPAIISSTPPPCTPVDVEQVDVDPPITLGSPGTVGVEYTFSLVGLTGTEPISVRWFFNLNFVGTGLTYSHVLENSDVKNYDTFTGLGVIYIFAIVENDCGVDQTNPARTYPAQRDDIP